MEGLESSLIKNIEEPTDFDKLSINYAFERSFQVLNDKVPDSHSDMTIPPIEHYEKIIKAFDESRLDDLKKYLDEFSTYIFKNGFDDVEEFYNTRFESVLQTLCSSVSQVQLAQSAFHIITLLQSKGPAYPMSLLSFDFMNFCVEFVNHQFSPVLYFALCCLYNICSQSEQLRDALLEMVPLTKIQSFLSHFDLCVREAAIDLACCYSKFPLNEEQCITLIAIAQKGLSLGDPKLHHSCYWILIRILRNVPQLTENIMAPEILSFASDIFDDEESYNLIPGMIFISYIYEMNHEIPDLSLNALLNLLGDTTDQMCQRQIYRTISKIVYRRPDYVHDMIKFGIIGQAAFAIDNAKFVDKVQIGLLICNIIQQDISYACDRIIQTKSIALFLTLIEFDDEELTLAALNCLTNIFNEAETSGRKSLLMKRFNINDGPEIFSKLEHDENEDIANLSRNFRENYLKQTEEE
ncbi:hypothetical protein TRFO_02244 [Tritrichomonas foetus]|uniref:Uncharacterized protein n=1 Tax=Tritrichomonas foetus TaxID=1144522 RepID=A0A1J4J7S0_9EUKA|nr:hypothetical protein TRFO_02244 [Tritrichomonas foetus]|eukprot:OHS95258.1 hypothetical protein TRFO_02244 [Tritrichomonas foetus]